MAWYNSIGALCSGILGVGGVCSAIFMGGKYAAGYQDKLDSVDRLASRVAALESRTGLSANPEGIRGSIGKQGEQGLPGERGQQGERGPIGPKGENGISPSQITDLDKRVSSLEKRPNAPAQVRSAANDVSVLLAKGIERASNGCIILTPDLFVATANVKQYDKICSDESGSTYSYVTQVLDDRIYLTTGTQQWSCHKIEPNCGFRWKSDVLFRLVNFIPGGDDAKNQFTLEFRRK